MDRHATRPETAADDRFAALADWVATIPGFGDARITPASGDASFRRYFRVQAGGVSRIAMDAPPPQEDCHPFVDVAGFLQQMSLHGPEVLEADFERGFLLLSDLGSRQYLDELVDRPESADALYGDAIGALVRMQREGREFQDRLPPYDERLLRVELSLFHDWLCERHLGLVFSEQEEAEWSRCCDVLVRNALEQPRVFVHRDYHSRNLMLTEDRNPGILDFQDAVEGPLTYDIVSLLRDCYVRWPDRKVEGWAMAFYEGLDENTRQSVDADAFMRFFDLTGMQRHLKAAGIFARLLHRDGKDGYMKDVPRTLAYIVAVARRYPELDFIAALIEERCLPALGGAP